MLTRHPKDMLVSEGAAKDSEALKSHVSKYLREQRSVFKRIVKHLLFKVRYSFKADSINR
jgi:23S rRNA maturation-related 3'-5' exoribonuclease YhaM